MVGGGSVRRDRSRGGGSVGDGYTVCVRYLLRLASGKGASAGVAYSVG